MAAPEVQQHNRTVLESLQSGDLVEFKRGIYTHWAVYIGNEQVIHLTGDGSVSSGNISSGSVFSICGIYYTMAIVKEENIWTVAGGCKFYRDNRVSPFTNAEIVRRARAKVGKINYHVLWSNCEHFASYCRCGNPQSEQAVIAVIIMFLGGVATLGLQLFRAFRG